MEALTNSASSGLAWRCLETSSLVRARQRTRSAFSLQALTLRFKGDTPLTSDSLDFVHELKHVFTLNNDLHAKVLAHSGKLLLHGVEIARLGSKRN